MTTKIKSKSASVRDDNPNMFKWQEQWRAATREYNSEVSWGDQTPDRVIATREATSADTAAHWFLFPTDEPMDLAEVIVRRHGHYTVVGYENVGAFPKNLFVFPSEEKVAQFEAWQAA